MNSKSFPKTPKIARLIKLTQDLQQSRTPDETLRAFQRGFASDGQLTASLLLSTRDAAPGEVRVLQMHLERGAGDPAFADKMPVMPLIVRKGLLAQMLRSGEPRLFEDLDWSADSALASCLQGYSSAIAVPFQSKRVAMNWIVLLRMAPGHFNVSELGETLERVALGGALLENQMLSAELKRVYERIDEEAKQVGTLQRALLPPTLPSVAGLEIATSYQPSGRAGGDLYDFFPLHDEDDPAGAEPSRWCIFIGDVAGHGLAAAVVMAMVQTVLHARPSGIKGAADLLAHVNRQLCSKQIGGFCTAFLGVYEPRTRTLSYANAGHPPPLIRRHTTADLLALNDAVSLPLGIMDSESFSSASVRLEEGDALLFYTDGIVEARNEGGMIIDQERLSSFLATGSTKPSEVTDRIRAALDSGLNGKAPEDDQTMVAALAL